jgi:predicted DNA binding protein
MKKPDNSIIVSDNNLLSQVREIEEQILNANMDYNKMWQKVNAIIDSPDTPEAVKIMALKMYKDEHAEFRTLRNKKEAETADLSELSDSELRALAVAATYDTIDIQP